MDTEPSSAALNVPKLPSDLQNDIINHSFQPINDKYYKQRDQILTQIAKLKTQIKALMSIISYEEQESALSRTDLEPKKLSKNPTWQELRDMKNYIQRTEIYRNNWRSIYVLCFKQHTLFERLVVLINREYLELCSMMDHGTNTGICINEVNTDDDDMPERVTVLNYERLKMANLHQISGA